MNGQHESSALIKNELGKIFISNGEPLPATFDQMLQVWVDDLKEIPQNQISASFQKARKANSRFRMIKAAHVLEAWEGLKSGFNREDWRVDDGKHRENVRRFAYYTIDSLPWCYISNRHRDLIRKFRDGKLSDDEALEWEQVQKLRWRRENLVLNEGVADKVRGMTLPDEIVPLYDLPHDVQEVIGAL